MNVRTRRVGDVWVLRPDGNVTIGGGELTLRKAVRELLAQRHVKLLLDLRDVSYVDSAGLGEILDSKQRAVQQAGDLRLFGARPKVHEILVASRVSDALTIYDEEQQALASF